MVSERLSWPQEVIRRTPNDWAWLVSWPEQSLSGMPGPDHLCHFSQVVVANIPRVRDESLLYNLTLSIRKDA